MLTFDPSECDHKDILYSFVGSSRTHPIRRELVNNRHPRGEIYDAAPSLDKYWWQRTDNHQLMKLYRDIIRRSKFVLCPRGVSSLSYRIFDAMAAGAIPVIIADDVILPRGPIWEGCAVLWPEARLHEISDQLARLEAQATEMGAKARLAWETFFSPASSFDYLCSLAFEVLPGSRPLWRQIINRLNARMCEWSTGHVLRKKVRFLLRDR